MSTIHEGKKWGSHCWSWGDLFTRWFLSSATGALGQILKGSSNFFARNGWEKKIADKTEASGNTKTWEGTKWWGKGGTARYQSVCKFDLRKSKSQFWSNEKLYPYGVCTINCYVHTRKKSQNCFSDWIICHTTTCSWGRPLIFNERNRFNAIGDLPQQLIN